MSNRDGHTTIRVKNEVADKLRKIQEGTDSTLSDIISQCISHIEGTVEDDTENIYREQVAYDLQYYDADSSKVKYITFRDCANSKVGDIFDANTNITSEEYSNKFAEVIFKDQDSVVLRLTQTVIEKDNERRFNKIIHISLF